MFDLELGWDRPARAMDPNSSEHVLRIRLRPSAGAKRIPLRVALALDTSGSMEGAKLSCARRACISVAQALCPEDRLCLAGFADSVLELLPVTLRSQLDLDLLEKRLASLQAVGVTRTDLALDWLAKSLSGDARSARVAVLVTDGHPTDHAGKALADVASLLEQANRVEQAGATLSAVGLGDAAGFNTTFLNDLTARGQGHFLYAADEQMFAPMAGGYLERATRIVASDVALLVRPLLPGLKLTSCCQFTPVCQPMDCPTLLEGAWRIRLTNVRGDVPTDALLRVEVPPTGFGLASGPRHAVAVEAHCGAGLPVQGRLDITYSTSFRDAQHVNHEIDQARLHWDAALYQVAILHSPSLTDTAEWLDALQKSAQGAGLAQVADDARRQLDSLRRSGQVSAHLTARMSSELQVPGGST